MTREILQDYIKEFREGNASIVEIEIDKITIEEFNELLKVAEKYNYEFENVMYENNKNVAVFFRK